MMKLTSFILGLALAGGMAVPAFASFNIKKADPMQVANKVSEKLAHPKEGSILKTNAELLELAKSGYAKISDICESKGYDKPLCDNNLRYFAEVILVDCEGKPFSSAAIACAEKIPKFDITRPRAEQRPTPLTKTKSTLTPPKPGLSSSDAEKQSSTGKKFIMGGGRSPRGKADDASNK